MPWLVRSALTASPPLAVSTVNERAKRGVINWPEAITQTRDLLAKVGLTEAPDTRVADIGVGKQQLVEIAKALSMQARLLIMDEPTAALGVKEGNMVLELIRRVRDKGLPVILISHNMPHVFEIADRIHVARLGKRAAVLNPKKISMSDTVAVMTGAMRPEDIPADCLA